MSAQAEPLGNESHSHLPHIADSLRTPRLARRPETLRWPYALSKRGARLLDAQCWAWGQDIKRAEGNLLLAYGFTRLRPPSGVTGCSQYTLDLDEEIIIRIWGFGVFAGAQQGIYLNRFAFVPRTAERQDAWSAMAFAADPRARSWDHMQTFLNWVMEYESWIHAMQGRRYRTATLTTKYGTGAPNLLDGWKRFREDVAALT